MVSIRIFYLFFQDKKIIEILNLIYNVNSEIINPRERISVSELRKKPGDIQTGRVWNLTGPRGNPRVRMAWIANTLESWIYFSQIDNDYKQKIWYFTTTILLCVRIFCLIFTSETCENWIKYNFIILFNFVKGFGGVEEMIMYHQSNEITLNTGGKVKLLK